MGEVTADVRCPRGCRLLGTRCVFSDLLFPRRFHPHLLALIPHLVLRDSKFLSVSRELLGFEPHTPPMSPNWAQDRAFPSFT